MRSTSILVATLAIALGGALASSGDALADPASAPAPPLGRVLTSPTAWLPPAGAVVATAGGGVGAEGLGNAGEGLISLGYGLGSLASVEVDLNRDVRACAPCAGERPQGMWLGRAAFRLGAPEDAWFSGMPALVLGVRATWTSRGPGAYDDARVGEAYLVASRAAGPVRLHAGVIAIDAGFDDVDRPVALRPTAAIEWTPRDLPRSTLMADVAWLPRLEPDRIELEWAAGLGVRYQALTWGSIELAVRNRQDDGLAGTTVMVRVNGVFASRLGDRRGGRARR